MPLPVVDRKTAIHALMGVVRDVSEVKEGDRQPGLVMEGNPEVFSAVQWYVSGFSVRERLMCLCAAEIVYRLLQSQAEVDELERMVKVAGAQVHASGPIT
jgi:hypothetical protein